MGNVNTNTRSSKKIIFEKCEICKKEYTYKGYYKGDDNNNHRYSRRHYNNIEKELIKLNKLHIQTKQVKQRLNEGLRIINQFN